MTAISGDILTVLRRAGLADLGLKPSMEPLTGGVSSDIWRVDLPAGPVCVKRALAQLKVAADWQAPVERNQYEAEWLRVAAQIVPEAVPALLCQDEIAGALAMSYLDGRQHPIWKQQLRDGRVDPAMAAAVGDRLGRIHAGTAHRPDIAERFASDAIFHAIRLEPYLLATAEKHADLARPLRQLVKRTAATKLVLIHGDVSPKNILAGPRGPVFLDAECACYGDPAFDLAFCLNHLLLKCLWNRPAAGALLAAFDALVGAYMAEAVWEPRGALERRTATLLPGLLLARVDGKSPVEYVTAKTDKEHVRTVAQHLLLSPVSELAAVRDAWAMEIGA